VTQRESHGKINQLRVYLVTYCSSCVGVRHIFKNY